MTTQAEKRFLTRFHYIDPYTLEPRLWDHTTVVPEGVSISFVYGMSNFVNGRPHPVWTRKKLFNTAFNYVIAKFTSDGEELLPEVRIAKNIFTRIRHRNSTNNKAYMRNAFYISFNPLTRHKEFHYLFKDYQYKYGRGYKLT